MLTCGAGVYAARLSFHLTELILLNIGLQHLSEFAVLYMIPLK
jgi:hypothetical protein